MVPPPYSAITVVPSANAMGLVSAEKDTPSAKAPTTCMDQRTMPYSEIVRTLFCPRTEQGAGRASAAQPATRNAALDDWRSELRSRNLSDKSPGALVRQQ